jgi:hypothetical protein
MDEDRIEKTEGFETLKRNLDRMLEAVAAFALERAKMAFPEAREGE